jgi:hypothetical protein
MPEPWSERGRRRPRLVRGSDEPARLLSLTDSRQHLASLRNRYSRRRPERNDRDRLILYQHLQILADDIHPNVVAFRRRPPEDLATLTRFEKQLEAAFDDINDNYYAAGCPLSRIDGREWSRVIMPHIRQLLKKYEHAIQDTMSYRRGIAENVGASTLRRQRRDFVQSVVDFDEKLQNLAESLNEDEI